ncbi:MAG: hypothetical protein PHQ59_02895 [Candidatus Daviesbacteria bacterium]|nr:hypothetical protein [Candidatus Daviesbacteria bacterium]
MMFKRAVIGLLIISSFLFVNPHKTDAQQNNINCSNRFVTAVNPVRSRQLWIDKTLKPIQDQYNLVVNNNFPTTWLIQNDVLYDDELLNKIKSFNRTQEFGLLLEVSDQLAKNARVLYPPFVPWYNPKAVFLSGYTQSERRLLIDKMFKDFFQIFGYYPKSVGAWWIDSYSLDYLKEKYGVTAALIVADQRNTDSYGVWGQWWSVPYFPSKANILTPASSLTNKQPITILQWAQRDPVLAYEADYHSSYSLQANDYTLLGKDINYFKNLVNVYLDCQNRVGQITIGLETGMESIRSLPEYERQLQYLKSINFLNPVTMSQFAEQYSRIYPEYQKESTVSYLGYTWKLTTSGRDNDKLNEHIKYQQDLAFQDYFLPSQSSFLDRKLPISNTISNSGPLYLYIGTFVFWGVFLFIRRKVKLLFVSTLFVIASFGLILRSTMQFGWFVFYGPVIKDLPVLQLVITFFGYLLIFFIDRFLPKDLRKYLYLIPLTFGLDSVVHYLRFSFISNRYYLGILTDAFHFFGISFEKPFIFSLVNQDLPSYQAVALLHFDYNLVWQNFWFAIIAFPLVHLILALILGLFLRLLSARIRIFIITILIMLLTLYLFNMWLSDPRAAVISATIK